MLYLPVSVNGKYADIYIISGIPVDSPFTDTREENRNGVRDLFGPGSGRGDRVEVGRSGGGILVPPGRDRQKDAGHLGRLGPSDPHHHSRSVPSRTPGQVSSHPIHLLLRQYILPKKQESRPADVGRDFFILIPNSNPE